MWKGKEEEFRKESARTAPLVLARFAAVLLLNLKLCKNPW